MAGPNFRDAQNLKGDGGYWPLVARITVGRGDVAEGALAVVLRVSGLAGLRSTADGERHCANAGVTNAAVTAMAATNSLDLVKKVSPA